jgi:hypothetical protein
LKRDVQRDPRSSRSLINKSLKRMENLNRILDHFQSFHVNKSHRKDKCTGNMSVDNRYNLKARRKLVKI